MRQRTYHNIAQEAEIDISEFFWALLMQWKAIALCGIICGCVLAAGIYAKHNIAVGTEEGHNSSADEFVLSEDERLAVENAVFKYRSLNKYQSIFQSSLYYQLDPEQMQCLVLSYRIHADDGESGIILYNAYQEWLASEDVQKRIGEVYGGSDLRDMSRMISVSSGEGDVVAENESEMTLTIRVLLQEDIQKERMDQCVQSIVKDYHDEATKRIGNHTVTFLSENVRRFRDLNLLKEYMEHESELLSLKGELSAALKGFNDTQKQAYQNYIDEENTNQWNDETESISEVGRNDCNLLRYFCIGAFASIVAYMGLFALWWGMAGTVRQTKELAGEIGIPPLGEIRLFSVNTILDKVFKDRRIYNSHYQGWTDEENAVRFIVEKMKMRFEEDDTVLLVLPAMMMERQKNCVNRIVENASDTTIHLLSDISILEEELTNPHSRVIQVSVAGKTHYKDVQEIYDICYRQHADIAGHILIDA